MKNFYLQITNYHTLWLKLLLVPVTALCIVYFFPKGQKFRYEFRKGTSWQYENLRAPFDFAINKPEEELNREKSEIRLNSPMCYRMNMSIGEKELRDFEEEVNGMKDSLKISSQQKSRKIKKQSEFPEIRQGEELLIYIFSCGLGSERNQASPTVILFKNNATEEIPAKKIFSPESAGKYIDKQTEKWNDELKSVLLPVMKNHLSINLIADKEMTEKFLDDALSSVSVTTGKATLGELIISKGENISAEKFQILESLREEYKTRFPERNRLSDLLGNFMLVFISLSLLMIFLVLFRKDIFADNKKVFFFLLIIFLMGFLYSRSLKSQTISPYVVPLCILPIIIRTFFDTRLALYSHLVLILILGFIAPDGFEFAFIQLTSGMVAIFSIVNLRNRSQFFFSSALIFAVSVIAWTSISLIHEGTFGSIDFENVKWFAGNALLTLLAYPLIYITEKSFGFVSDVSLLELSDSNTPLLRELAAKAPGTFQHSLQVANLAESVIYKIGGNSLMVRAGALYHDIGKMDTPVYFIENQISSVNPHDEISFEESASVIIKHVLNGIEIAKKNNLPEQLIDFIRTHHGTTRVQYFYRSYLKNFPDEIMDEQKFRYPGPLPYSKETAVLMMADSVEAAARSLKKTDEQAIENLVESVIENLVSEKQFVNCNITFRDIHSAKKIFIKMLSSIHHTRVEYPK